MKSLCCRLGIHKDEINIRYTFFNSRYSIIKIKTCTRCGKVRSRVTYQTTYGLIV